MPEKPNKTSDTTETDSSTRVNYPQNVFSGVRKTIGYKGDTGLYKEFKRVAQATMGSVCRPLECFQIAFLTLNREQVNFGTTVKIESLHIERNLRPRRLLDIDVEGFEKCYVKGCKKRAVGRAVFLDSGKEFGVCSYHRKDLLGQPTWKVLE